jgi:hypothetical protein
MNEGIFYYVGGRIMYCINALLQKCYALAVRVAVYVRKITVLHKHYTNGLNLPCANVTISIISVITVPCSWGLLPGRDEY